VADPIVLKLASPVEIDGEKITALSFRPLKGKDLRSVQRQDGYETAFLLKLAGRLCGQPDLVIDELSGADLMEVIAIVGGFLGGSPPTGSARSPS
jgi:Phage tail assembly chaperone proteins, E, or 41 or 14